MFPCPSSPPYVSHLLSSLPPPCEGKPARGHVHSAPGIGVATPPPLPSLSFLTNCHLGSPLFLVICSPSSFLCIYIQLIPSVECQWVSTVSRRTTDVLLEDTLLLSSYWFKDTFTPRRSPPWRVLAAVTLPSLWLCRDSKTANLMQWRENLSAPVLNEGYVSTSVTVFRMKQMPQTNRKKYNLLAHLRGLRID